jgi:flagellar motor switch protein FliM
MTGEIDAATPVYGETQQETNAAATSLDFSRLERVPKSQLRAIHTLHDDFSRNASANLSAYLRAFVGLNVSSVEQVTYSEYLQGIASPTCLSYIDLKPYDATTVMEISPSIVFTLVELLLGGTAKEPPLIDRKITEIEKGIMQGVLRIILAELDEAWKNVDELRFEMQVMASEPQLVHVVAPSEAVLVITFDLRVGPASGVLNFAIPSSFLKRLRTKFEQLGKAHKADPTERDRALIARLISDANLDFEARLEPTPVSAADLVDLEVGDVLMLGHALERPVIGTLNGQHMYNGHMVVNDGKFLLQVHQISPGSTTDKFVRSPSI